MNLARSQGLLRLDSSFISIYLAILQESHAIVSMSVLCVLWGTMPMSENVVIEDIVSLGHTGLPENLRIEVVKQSWKPVSWRLLQSNGAHDSKTNCLGWQKDLKEVWVWGKSEGSQRSLACPLMNWYLIFAVALLYIYGGSRHRCLPKPFHGLRLVWPSWQNLLFLYVKLKIILCRINDSSTPFWL